MSHPVPAPARPHRPQSASRAWLAAGIVVGGVLALLRAASLFDLAVEVRGIDPALADFAIAGRFLPQLVHALVLGVLACAAVFEGARRAPRARWAARAGAALLVLAALAGWPTAPAHDLPPASGPGIAGLGALALAAAVVTAVLVTVALGLRGRPRLQAALGSPGGLGLAVLLGLSPPVGWMLRELANPPMMGVREVVRDLLAEPGAFEVLAAPEGTSPEPTVLSPWVDFRYDTADKPALRMPPPCEVAFEVRPEDGEVVLRAAAGADVSARRPAGAVRFEVLVDGERRFDQTLPLAAEGAERAWRHVGGADGLALRPGNRVILRTAMAGEPQAAAPDLAVGFGGLFLERRRELPRTLATREHPNVVLVVMDTLRADRTSSLGYPRPTTPHLDALAAGGILFEGARATSSWTWPATASILTGLPPDEHGVTSNESCTLGLVNETLAEALQRAGYTTAAFAANPLIAPERYFDQGFEHFDAAPQMRKTERLWGDVSRWIGRHAGVRFFLYLHWVDPHTPHEPHPQELARLGGERPADFPAPVHEGRTYDGMDWYTSLIGRPENRGPAGEPRGRKIVPPAHREWIERSYDASVATGDRWFGALLARIEELGIEDRTVIAFTSDHGEELFDHGSLEHGHTLFDELTRVPLVIAGPGVPEGVRVGAPVSNRHLAPTLARLAGTRLARVEDALDLTALAPDTPAPLPVRFQTEKGVWNGNRPENLYGIMTPALEKLIWDPSGRSFGAPREAAPNGGQVLLFDLAGDPGERMPLCPPASPNERAAELRDALRRALERDRARRRAIALGGGAGAGAQLGDLGYTETRKDAGGSER